MKLYLYLEKIEFVSSWTEGGEIPLNLASKYKSDERIGIFTPDEVLQQHLENAPIEAINALGKISGDARVRMFNVTIQVGANQYKNVNYYRGTEDALILCLSTKLDKNLAKKLNKTACIEITDLKKLIHEFSKQIGVTGISGLCEYTLTDNRNHFLKSVLDSWQEEFRIVWKGIRDSKMVKVPKGIAKDITEKIK